MSEESHASERKPSLLDLPPAALRRIFNEGKVITRRNLAICKALLPYTVDALYEFVTFLGTARLQQFAEEVGRPPALLEKVQRFAFAKASPQEMKDEQVSGARISKHAAKKAPKSGSHSVPVFPTLPTNATPRSTGTHSVLDETIRLLKHFLRHLPSLQTFVIHGLSPAIVREIFPLHSPSSKPLALCIIFTGDDFGEEAGDELLIYHLAQLRHLTRLDLRLNRSHSVPLPLLNLPHEKLHHSSRSWDVEELVMREGHWAGPELCHLFSSLTTSLRAVELSFLAVSPSFPTDLLRLPPSLTSLTLMAGATCPSGCIGGSIPIPLVELGGVLPHFPNVRQVILSGNVVTPQTLYDLTRLRKLELLALGPHAAIDAESILALLPPNLPHLSFLQISFCCGLSHPPLSSYETYLAAVAGGHVPTHRARMVGGTLPTVVWPDGFGANDAEGLLRRADEMGVKVEGTVRCAMGMCSGTSEKRAHERICIGDGA
ncbi:hypothetical protein JCM6882_007105 [Rhodosporidiobolus microsporus]